MGIVTEYFIICVVIICYPVSIFFDTSVYNLKFILRKDSDFRYWMSTIQVYQYFARTFMVIFIPGISLLTEMIGDFNLIHTITISIHFVSAGVILLSFFIFSKINILNLFIVKIINQFTGKKDVSDGFQLKKLTRFFSFALFRRRLFLASFISHFLVATSMTYIFILSFYFRETILILNSLTQILNMVAMIILLVIVDPRIMSSFDSSGSGEDELKIIYISRSLAHTSVGIMFLCLKLLF